MQLSKRDQTNQTYQPNIQNYFEKLLTRPKDELVVEPRAGRLSIFTSGSENVHRVTKVNFFACLLLIIILSFILFFLGRFL